MKKIIVVSLVLVTLISITLNTQIEEKQDKWRSQTVYNGSASFVQTEIHDQTPVISFYTDQGVLMFEKDQTNIPFYRDIQKYMGESQWRQKVVDGNGNSGAFLSMKNFDGELAFAYQDSSLGDEKLFYTTKQNGSWVPERVDWAGGTGLGSGMYPALTQLNGKPVIFYHTSEGRKFVKAEKNQTGKWNKQVLETGVGWFTSAETCGSKIFVLYRGRNTETVYKAEYDGEFETQNITGKTDAETSVDATDCVLRAAFHNAENQKIEYFTENLREKIGDGKLSRLSLEYMDRPKISFRVYGEGLYYAEKTNDENWSTRLIDNRTYAGEYNDITLSENGKPHIAYTQENQVVYTTYGTKGYRNVKTLANIISGLMIALTTLISTIFWREKMIETVTQTLGKIS